MNKICIYLKADGHDCVCKRTNPPKILGDIMGYSGKTCVKCRYKLPLTRRRKK